jgi:hypothetical protein
MHRFTSTTRLSRAQDLISTELDQETVLMSIEAGAYYGLKGPAQTIWNNLETPLTFSALVDRLVKEYAVSQETCSEDLQQFLAKMEEEGLLHGE